VSVTVRSITVDCADPERIARFWASALTSASSRHWRYAGLFGGAAPDGRRGPVGDRYLHLVFAAAF
jgi:hypothetical protein